MVEKTLRLSDMSPLDVIQLRVKCEIQKQEDDRGLHAIRLACCPEGALLVESPNWPWSPRDK